MAAGSAGAVARHPRRVARHVSRGGAAPAHPADPALRSGRLERAASGPVRGAGVSAAGGDRTDAPGGTTRAASFCWSSSAPAPSPAAPPPCCGRGTRSSSPPTTARCSRCAAGPRPRCGTGQHPSRAASGARSDWYCMMRSESGMYTLIDRDGKPYESATPALSAVTARTASTARSTVRARPAPSPAAAT